MRRVPLRHRRRWVSPILRDEETRTPYCAPVEAVMGLQSRVFVAVLAALCLFFAVPPLAGAADVRVTSIGGSSVWPGGSAPVTATVVNSGGSAVTVHAVALRIFIGDKDVTKYLLVVPLQPFPVQVNAGEVVRFSFQVTSPRDAPSGRLAVEAALFGYDTSVGGGKNLLDNPSLEGISGYSAAKDPPGWSFGQDYPSTAEHAWVRDEFVSGQASYRLSKQGGLLQSYLQQVVPGSKLKPNTTYTFSGWVKTEKLPAGAAAALVVWWDDGAYHQSLETPPVTGTSGWRKVIGRFTTGPRQPNLAIFRAQVSGSPGGSAWFDDLSLSEGGQDGGFTVFSQRFPLGRVLGDANGDGAVTSADVVLVLRASLGLATLSEEGLAAVDFNRNAKVDHADVVVCLRMALGLPTKY
jgi:hypothetical protein